MVLSAKNLSFYYEDNEVFSNLNFTLSNFETMVVMGVNGAGKSTLLKIILSLLKPKSGDIFLDEENISNFSLSDKCKIFSFVPQEQSLPFGFLVEDVVIMGRNAFIPFYAKPSLLDIQKANQAMEIVGISSLAKRYYNSLSGGEMQLVMIARALSGFAPFLVMDEPISHLDVHRQEQILKIIKMVNKELNIGVILTSHYPDHALMVGDKFLFLDACGKSSFGIKDEIFNKNELKRLFKVDFEILSYQGKDRVLPNWNFK